MRPWLFPCEPTPSLTSQTPFIDHPLPTRTGGGGVAAAQGSDWWSSIYTQLDQLSTPAQSWLPPSNTCTAMASHCRPLFAAAAIALSLSIPLASDARPLLAQSAAAGATRNTTFFKKAQQELAGNYYFLYRIIDRLARANSLDQNPWRIQNLAKYDMNAYATEVNLIAVYDGLLDVLAGDADAMACVIGHEMAHHVERHIPIRESNAAQAQQRLEAKQQELIQQQREQQSNAKTWSIFGGFVRSVTGLPVHTNPAGQVDPRQMQEELKQAAASENQNLATASQDHELQADRLGYQYMARAGFDPKGCLRVMEALGRMPGAEFDGTHPAIPRRIEQLRTLMVEMPASSLATEGRMRLQSTAALTYAKSADQRSLRVNSRFGSAKGGFLMNDL